MQKNIHPFCVAVAPSSCHSCRTPHSAYKTNICESDSLYQRGHRIHLALQQSLVPNLGAKRRYKFVAVQSISQRVQQPRHRRRKILDRLNDDPVYLKKKKKKKKNDKFIYKKCRSKKEVSILNEYLNEI